MRDFNSFLKDAEQIAGAKFNADAVEYARREYADMVSLRDAEQSAKLYAAKRKRQAGFSDVGEIYTDNVHDEDGSIRDRIWDFYRRTGKVVNG